VRVLCVTGPYKTHFLLMAPLAWALRAAGHEVRVACHPDFADEVVRAGLTAVPVGRPVTFGLGADSYDGPPAEDEPDYVANLPEPAGTVPWGDLREGMEYMVGQYYRVVNFSLFRDLVAYARLWQPDLVLWEASVHAGGVAAKSCGAAHARMLVGYEDFGVSRAQYLRRMAEQPSSDQADPMGDWLSAYARQHHVAYSEDLTTGSLTIDQFPASLRLESELPCLPMRFAPFGGGAEVPQWLRAAPDRPRVAVTMGFSDESLDGLAVGSQGVFDALADLDVEVVTTMPDQERARQVRVPSNMRLVSHVPLDALAATCSAIIHHGGTGSGATSSLYGVPQLVLPPPGDFDSHALGSRLAAHGAGLVVDPARDDAAAVRAAVQRLLTDSSFRRRAAELRDEYRAMPSPAEVVGSLEALVAERPL